MAQAKPDANKFNMWLNLPKDPTLPTKADLGKGAKGTRGRPLMLKSNHFEISIREENKYSTFYKYNVCVMTSGKENMDLFRNKKVCLFEEMKKTYPRQFVGPNKFIGFDGQKLAFSVGNILGAGGAKETFKIQFKGAKGRQTNYEISLEQVGQTSLSDVVEYFTSSRSVGDVSIALQALEVMYNYTHSVKHTRVGRSFFLQDYDQAFGISSGKEGVMGFFSSLRPSSWKDGSLLLNIDTSFAIFYKHQSVLDFMREIGFKEGDFNRELPPNSKRDLQNRLGNLKIEVTHTLIKRTYKVCGVSDKGPKHLYFDYEDPKTKRTSKVSVEKYFRDVYKKNLNYPNLNCLQVGQREKKCYIPIEFCVIAKNQKVNKPDSFDMREFIKGTAVPPNERLSNIQKMKNVSDFKSNPVTKALGFTINDQPLKFQGRVLPAPDLKMHNQVVKPFKGVWDIRNKQFDTKVKIDNWAILNLNCYKDRSSNRILNAMRNPDGVYNFADMLCKLGREKGLEIPRNSDVRNALPNTSLDELLKIISKFKEMNQTNSKYFLLIILPVRADDIYPKIKQIGDIEVGIVTQCIKSINVEKSAPATITNLLLKINNKLGGVNFIINKSTTPMPLFGAPILIMGADVNHPPASTQGMPDEQNSSLVAVCGSYDMAGTKYVMEVRCQKKRVEIIKDLKAITKKILINFLNSTKFKPHRIVMFRDGVSESQFIEVLSAELKAMRQACTELEAEYKPAITFICVQKRHHTRFFAEDGNNVPAGTTVDTCVTHPREIDYYLCSHAGIKGTSRPTHYHVLWDDSSLSMDALQALTYSLCHLYSRCARSVSIPAPVYYAHLAAYRAKVHLSSLKCNNTDFNIANMNDEDITQLLTVNKLIKTHYFV